MWTEQYFSRSWRGKAAPAGCGVSSLLSSLSFQWVLPLLRVLDPWGQEGSKHRSAGSDFILLWIPRPLALWAPESTLTREACLGVSVYLTIASFLDRVHPTATGEGGGPGYTTWPISTPQPIGPGQTPDPSQASWAFCLENPSLGLKAIDFKQCFGVWLEPRHAVAAMWPVLQRFGHERGMRRLAGGQGGAASSLSCQPLGRPSFSALSRVPESHLYPYHELFHGLCL